MSDNDEIDSDIQITNVRLQHPIDRLRIRIRDRIIKQEENEDRETIAYVSNRENGDGEIIDIKIIDVHPQHPRERLKIKLKQQNEYNKTKIQRGYESSDVETTNVHPVHPRDILRRRNKIINVNDVQITTA